MALKVNEVFRSIQGEGYWTGTPSTFIRLQGCGVGCPWCDTKHTWTTAREDKTSPSTVIQINPGNVQRWGNVGIDALVAQVENAGTRHVVISGGEPLEQDVSGLCAALLARGHSVQIETSGTCEAVVDARVWVTCSPKVGMPGGRDVALSMLRRANEIKHPVAIERNVAELLELLDRIDPHRSSDGLVYVQPVHQAKRAFDLCLQACYEHGWRLSLQAHKYVALP